MQTHNLITSIHLWSPLYSGVLLNTSAFHVVTFTGIHFVPHSATRGLSMLRGNSSHMVKVQTAYNYYNETEWCRTHRSTCSRQVSTPLLHRTIILLSNSTNVYTTTTRTGSNTFREGHIKQFLANVFDFILSYIVYEYDHQQRSKKFPQNMAS